MGQPAAVQYTKAENGWIAYQALGAGPPNIVMLPALFTHLDLMWEEPSFASFLKNLASFSRLVIFDRSGTGLSDPIPEGTSIAYQTAADFSAILEANDFRRSVIFGLFAGGTLAAHYAAGNPDRVSELMLYATPAFRPQIDPVDIEDTPPYEVDPVIVHGERMEDWTRRFFRSAGSPRVIRSAREMMSHVDIRADLDQIQARTLVMGRRDDPLVPMESARYLGAHIPNADVAEFEGDNPLPWFGDTRAVLETIERFLLGNVRSKQQGNPTISRLTNREQQVIQLVSADLTAAEIAERLNISARTVEHHVANAYAKLGIHSRAKLNRLALDLPAPESAPSA